MISDEELIEVVKASAPAIVAADGDALRQVAERKIWAATDWPQAAVAMATERRALLGKPMRTTTAPEAGWTLLEEDFEYGALAWLNADGIEIHLAKTTRGSRLEALKALYHLQGTLFPTAPYRRGARDVVLIRPMGNVVKGASIDVVSCNPSGRTSRPVALTAIAAMQVDRLPSTGVPPEPAVKLPPHKRRDIESG